MGGGLLRREPTDHTTLLGDPVFLPIFPARGWMNYMFKLSTWNEELAFESLRTLTDDFSIVKGIRALFLPKIATEIMELPLEGE